MYIKTEASNTYFIVATLSLLALAYFIYNGKHTIEKFSGNVQQLNTHAYQKLISIGPDILNIIKPNMDYVINTVSGSSIDVDAEEIADEDQIKNHLIKIGKKGDLDKLAKDYSDINLLLHTIKGADYELYTHIKSVLKK
jgi:hypothetical protein